MEDSLKFNFENLIVMDIANNHQGDLEHGIKIIKAIGELNKQFNFQTGLKFQFRQLDTFIHRDHKNKSNSKHINRFKETELNKKQYITLNNLVNDLGLISICTPFDESSVDMIIDLDIEILKIASCSANDWPLLEKAVLAGKPMICSTGGLSISQIDDLYSFLSHKGAYFSFMHCVSIYPTDIKDLELNQIDFLKNRFPDITIGWSTHEDPNELSPVQIAYAKGARMFERHVGIENKTFKLNGYSSNPEQLHNWLNSLEKAKSMCGQINVRPTSKEIETDSLLSLKRGVYAKKDIKKGSQISSDMVYFAMPIENYQLSSGELIDGIKTKSNLKAHEAVFKNQLDFPSPKVEAIIKKANHEVKAILNEARIHLGNDFKVEYSHHYGMEKFREIGAVLIDVVNREYCKKIIIQLPGQVHPQHFHKRKEETFQVLFGYLNVIIEGQKKVLQAGDTCLIQPGMWHGFWSTNACVFEEISTRHFNADSYYKDQKINRMNREDRKTIVNHWGRYELPTI